MPRYKSRSARVAQTVQLRFLHKCGITLRPGGTPEINRWWNHRDSDPILSSPGGATDQSQSVAPPGLGGSTGLAPVVEPPANLHRASGAKTCVETLGLRSQAFSWPIFTPNPETAMVFSLFFCPHSSASLPDK